MSRETKKRIFVLLFVLFMFVRIIPAGDCFAVDHNKDEFINYLDWQFLAEQENLPPKLGLFGKNWLEQCMAVGYYLQGTGTGNIVVPSHDAISWSSTYSISFWFYQSDSFNFVNNNVIETFNPFTTNWFISIQPDGRIYLKLAGLLIPGGSVVEMVSNDKAIINKWNHVVMTNDLSGNKLRIYLNGSLSKEITTIFGVLPGSPLSIYLFGITTAKYLPVSIDNIRIHQKVLSTDDVVSLYNNGLPTPATDADFSDADGWYSNFDDGSGVFVSGRLVVNGVGSDYNSNTAPNNFRSLDWRKEDVLPFSANAYLHGASDAILVKNQTSTPGANHADSSGQDFTLSFWIIPDNIVAQNIMNKYDTSTTTGLKIELLASGEIRATIDNGPSSSLTVTSSNTIEVGKWTHIVFAQDTSASTHLYVNNVKTSTTSSVTTYSNSENLIIFPNTITGGLEGFGIDQLRFLIGKVEDDNWVDNEYNGGKGREVVIANFPAPAGFETNFTYSQYVNQIWVRDGSNVFAFISTGVPGLDTGGTLTWKEGGFPFHVDAGDIKFYATSLEPDLAQTNFSQSIGAFPSTTTFSLQTLLVQPLTFNDSIVEIKLPVGGFGDWSDIKFLGINSEVIEVNAVDGYILNVVRRAVNGVLNSHPNNSLVRGLKPIDLFNDVFSTDYKQYRCLAVKNTSLYHTAYNFSVCIPFLSQNAKSSLKISLEIPKSQYLSRSSTSWDSMKVIDTSLIGTTEDYTDAYLRINSGPNSGQNRTISSFDSATGTHVLSSSLPVDFIDGEHSNIINYIIDSGPAQRISSGIDSPVFGTTDVSVLVGAAERASISMDINNEGGDKKNLKPNQVVYVWIERTLRKASGAFEANNMVIRTNYDLTAT